MQGAGGPSDDTTLERVLAVCSANRCRSPFTSGILRQALRGAGVTVDDAGFGQAGLPATDDTVATARRHGLALEEHRSTTVTDVAIDRADLVLAMERAHVRDLVLAHPEAWSRTFTLKELVRRGGDVGPRAPGEPIAAWLARAHEGRTRADLTGVSPHDDVADPTTDRRVDHDTMADELHALVRDLVRLVWPWAAPG